MKNKFKLASKFAKKISTESMVIPDKEELQNLMIKMSRKQKKVYRKLTEINKVDPIKALSKSFLVK